MASPNTSKISRTQANDFHPNLNLAVTHKVSPRLTLSLAAYLTYQQEPDFTNNFIGVDRRSGNYFFTNDKLSAAYVWTPRFSTVTSFLFVAINYADAAVGGFQNRTENTFGNEFRFLLLPTTSIIAEYRFEFISYETPTFQSPDSTTNYFLAGFDHSFSPRMNVSVRGGVSVRQTDGVDTVRLDPYGQASLNYTVGPHLTLAWTASYSLQEPDIVGSPARTSLQTSLTGIYKITPRITSNFSVFYEHDENDGQMSFFFIHASICRQHPQPLGRSTLRSQSQLGTGTRISVHGANIWPIFSRLRQKQILRRGELSVLSKHKHCFLRII